MNNIGEPIIEVYNKNYKEYFKILNLEWLELYFKVEPIDMDLLSNPDKIIDEGGEIFFAKLDNIIVGTCALLKIDENTFELAKMAVTKKAQGKKIGEQLGKAAIDYAKKKQIKIIILESNTLLLPALNLYRKLGFVEVPGYISSKYSRSNIKMELKL
jgi:GNAT superfamily N-acetyltransferase